MLKNSKILLFYFFSILFIVLNGFALLTEHYEFMAIPLIIFITYLALFKLDVLFLLVIFLVPISVNLNNMGMDLGVGIALPTEPIIVGMFLLVVVKLLAQGEYDIRILKHPITIAILINLFVIVVTTITSVHPVVSFKFLISRCWFLATFYFVAAQLFKKPDGFNKFNWLYVSGFLIIIAYTIYQHAIRGFDQKSANWVMNPFFNDHTSYGACLAFFFPFLIGVVFSKKVIGVKKILYGLVLVAFTVAIILSYTRAAWLSLVGALMVYLVLKYKVKWQILAGVGFVLALMIYASWGDISGQLVKNKQDSSSDLKEHVSSMSNVSSDASNLERLNRWNSAWQMFKEKPVFGWGPGVYAFEYAPFQSSKDKTIISTNSGNMGNAHSEYLGPLSESGIFGFISVLIIVITTIVTAVRLYKKNISPKVNFIVLTSFLGLVTYYVHGVLNNFLDTDKASAPFWGFTAAIVVMDVYFSNKGIGSEEKKELEA